LAVDFGTLHATVDTKVSWNTLCAGARLIEFRAMTLCENLKFPDGQRQGTTLASRCASKLSTISCICCASTLTPRAKLDRSKASHPLPFALRHTDRTSRPRRTTIARERAWAERWMRIYGSRRKPVVGIAKRIQPRAGPREHSRHDLGLDDRVTADVEARAHGTRRYRQ
jgi:hypothetical protein